MKRLLAIVLTALLSLSVFVPAYADNSPAITVGSVAAKAGDTVTLKLTVSNNPGVGAMTLTLKYDTEALTLTGVKNGSLFESMESGLNLVFYSSSDVTANGTLATVTFKISGSASGSYPIKLIVRETCNAAYEDVGFSSVSGMINVQNDRVFSVRVNGETKNAKPGDTLNISAATSYTERGLKYRFDRWTAVYSTGETADIVAAPDRANTTARISDKSVDINAQYYALGDVNGDGLINARDIQKIMRVRVGLESADGIFFRADYNEDGKLNSRDILMMLLDMVNGVIK